MAEGVLFTIAGGILKTLGPLITNEIVLLWGFRNELEDLQRTVSTIKAVLVDAEQRRAKSEAVSLWLGQLNDVLYEADDLLDTISTEALFKKAKKVCAFSPILKHPAHVLKMGHCLREIRGKIDAIAADITKFQFLVRREEGHRDWRRGDTYSYLGAESVVGRDDDKKALISRLKAPEVEGNVSIVPIVGIGGLGKTTLAKSIFNDPEIQKTFELKMWVCISDDFDLEVIVKKILESVTKKIPDNHQMDMLVEKFRKEIEGKKYLLVLDDVWCEASAKWSELNNLLMCGGRGSKVLVTTRKLSVAHILRAEPHQLGGLGEEDSWELFRQVAFVNGSELGNLEKMGREILKKCKGVPLAMKTVGRLLYSKGLDEWRKFMKDELSKITQEEEDIIPTLKLSYDELHSNLKHCFAFCSLFPKDHEFEITILINHWIAQGFVDFQENQCLEDVGHEYFNTLLWRSFFQEVSLDRYGRIFKCKMHDLMHDLAILVAGSLMTTLPSKRNINFQKIRHIAVTPSTVVGFPNMKALCEARKIRSFLCPSSFTYHDNGYFFKVDHKTIIKEFELLRILDLKGRLLTYIPSSIGKLKHLRFLNLSYNEKIKTLPNSITKLVNLQYLCLRNCFGIIKLPKDFKKLVNLRMLDAHRCQMQYLPCGFKQLVKLTHLDLYHCYKLRRLPHGMGRLTNLETLGLGFCSALKELPKDIGKLVNLRFLDIRNCRRVSYVPCGFEKLTNLKTLLGFKDYSRSPSKDSVGVDALSSVNDLTGDLTISGLSCGKGIVKEYKAANLKGKGNLNSLCLVWSNEVIVSGLDDDDESLEALQPHQNLKRLRLYGYCCPRLPSWLPLLSNLVSLTLNGCDKWQYLTPLSHLSFLESLSLSSMKGMEYVSNLGEPNDFSLSSSAQMMFFPSLKEMTLTDCPNLRGWWNGYSAEDDNLVFSFPLLSKLTIEDCPMLTWMPTFPHLEESLRLKNTSWKPLQQTLMMNMTAVIASSKFADSLGTPFSKLKKIEFCSIIDLEALLEEGLQNLISLEILNFYNCDKLKSLSPGVQYLTTVQNLVIYECPMFVEDENGMQWQDFKSLQYLNFWSLPKLTCLPPGLQHVATLKQICISSCKSLTTIEEWVHQCKSLEVLDIWNCDNLASLPVETCERWSLRRLNIFGCPILSQKCEKEKGEYWPKIAHIPDLQVEPPPKSKFVLQRMFRKIRDC